MFKTHIPYRADGMLGKEYNELMERSKTDWTLFLDHDVYLCNPHWHHICEEAIATAAPEVGLITCCTNNIGCKAQKKGNAPKSSNLREHIVYSQRTWEKYGYNMSEIDGITHGLSGFFMLIRKAAWADVGGFPGVGFFKEDGMFGRKLIKKGWTIARLDGLYIYHLRNRTEETWIKGQKVSKDYRLNRPV